MECESGIRNVKKYVIISLRSSYQHTIRNHPILMAGLCFLVLLNTLFPVLFSFLLYISPVIICTALLLGTLLSYGQTTYIPDHDVGVDVDTGVGVSTDSVSVRQRDDGNKYVALDNDDVQLIAGNSQVDEKVVDDGVSDDSEPRNETEFSNDQDVAGIHYSILSKNGLVVEDGSVAQQLDDTHGDDDNENDNEEDEEGDEDESSISGSSTSESSASTSASASVSSPDASMADIMPMLDELHPLLDLEAPQPAHISHDGSDAEEEAEDDNGDDDEEEAHDDDDKEGGHKSVITWTEDDQKNLIDLGTSELERNLRLENLIARRRARRLVVEKNLIDLDSTDPPHNMPPISTARGNPFDSLYDLYDNKPIPGSAPSMMFPRKNPFDIPYDSSEEKPNLTGDSFQQEFKKTFPQKDAFFRRHESFSLGSSAFGGARHASKWRPYFVPEKLAPDGVNYHLFQRQSSGFSDSKASSNPETGSICSSADEEEKTFAEHDFSQETAQPEASLSADQISNHAEIGSDLDHADIGNDSDHADIDRNSDQAESGSESDHTELGSDLDHVESGSDSSEQLDIDDEAKIKMEGVDNHQDTEIETNLLTSRERSYAVEFVESEVHPNVEIDEEGSTKSRLSSSSSSSSSSEDEAITYGKESTLINSSLEESNVNNVHDVVDDNQIKDPVYDSSPSAAEKLISLSFNSSDNHEEEPDTCLPPISINSDVDIEHVISDPHHESSAHMTPNDEESQEGTSDEDVHFANRISDVHDERSIDHVTSIGEYSQETTSNARIADKVSDVHHESIDPVTSIDKDSLEPTYDVLFPDKVADDHDSSDHVTSMDEDLQEATSDANVLYADNVSDVHNERSFDRVTSIDKDSQEATSDVLVADKISDVHESSDHVTSIDQDVLEANSDVPLADKASDDHENNDQVTPINSDLQEATSDTLFADKVSDVHYEIPDHASTTNKDLEEATSDVLFADKISNVHHESNDRGTSSDKESQETTSGALHTDNIYDVHISDRVTSDEASQEAISDVLVEDETPDAHHENSDHVTITDQNMQEAISDAPVVCKISDVHHGSSDPVHSTDEDSQEDTSDVPVVHQISDVHHGSNDPVASTDEDLQEAASVAVFSDKVSDVHHESSDHETTIEEESQDTTSTMHAEDEKELRLSNGTVSVDQ